MDYIDEALNQTSFDDKIVIHKGSLYICLINYEDRFKSYLAGNFNVTVGLTSKTLKDISKIVKSLNDNLNLKDPPTSYKWKVYTLEE